jgi:hypothetical protein
MSRTEHKDEEPEVFAVVMDGGSTDFPRRTFLELAAMSATVAGVVAGCGEPKPSDTTTTSAKTPTTTPPTTTTTTTPPPNTTTTPPPNTTTTPPPPPKPGKVPAGTKGLQLRTGGGTYHLPCGSPIPAGAVCTCNCVVVPKACSCVGHQSCSCVGHQSCSCVGHQTCTCVGNTSCSCVSVSHYWHPN